MTKTKYIAYVKSINPNVHTFNVEIPGIHVLGDGFWVNSKDQYTQGSDAYIWVPIGSVLLVIKREVLNEND